MELSIKNLTDALIEAVENKNVKTAEVKKIEMSENLRKIASHLKTNLSNLSQLTYNDLHTYIEKCNTYGTKHS